MAARQLPNYCYYLHEAGATFDKLGQVDDFAYLHFSKAFISVSDKGRVYTPKYHDSS